MSKIQCTADHHCCSIDVPYVLCHMCLPCGCVGYHPARDFHPHTNLSEHLLCLVMHLHGFFTRITYLRLTVVTVVL